MSSIDRFVLSFIPDADSLEEEKLRRYRLLVSISFITVLYAVVFAPVCVIMNYHTALWCIGATCIVCLFIPFLLKNRFSFFMLANVYLFLILVMEVFLYRTSSGLFQSPTDPEFVAFIPVIGLLLIGRSGAIFWMIAVIILIFIFGVLELYGVDFPIEIESEWVRRFVIMTAVGHVVLMFILVNVFESTKEEILKKLKDEKGKVEDLLLNILPSETAQELQQKGYADAKLHEKVTVLFTDFKDFTIMSESVSPRDLVNELDTCFKAFDKIISNYKIEKIKTVGDAYIAASGVPTENPDHAKDIVAAAVEISGYMKTRRGLLGNQTFEIRLGVHTGPVIAGIVGLKKFSYDIWGDTVNTAARMEQNSQEGKINISETTYLLVKDIYTCQYRGEIDAKNKGKMKMYFVSDDPSTITF